MTLKEILADPSISSWVKDAIKMAYQQDLRQPRCSPVAQDARDRYTQTLTGTCAVTFSACPKFSPPSESVDTNQKLHQD
jgi:hypothetical protein